MTKLKGPLIQFNLDKNENVLLYRTERVIRYEWMSTNVLTLHVIKLIMLTHWRTKIKVEIQMLQIYSSVCHDNKNISFEAGCEVLKRVVPHRVYKTLQTRTPCDAYSSSFRSKLFGFMADNCDNYILFLIKNYYLSLWPTKVSVKVPLAIIKDK